MNKHGPNLILFFACIILAKNGVAGNYCDSEKCVRFTSTLEVKKIYLLKNFIIS
jgi:hypothetical protein